MARHVRKGDEVIVTAGRDRGKTGQVTRVIPAEDRVVVQGVNIRTKHMKPTQQNQQGGTIQIEMPIHISNVSPMVMVDGKPTPTRVRFEVREDGSKVRVAAKTGEVIGRELRKARK